MYVHMYYVYRFILVCVQIKILASKSESAFEKKSKVHAHLLRN